MSTLEIRNLGKTYGGQVALSSVSHTFAPGKITTIVGPSGSGKTTLLMLIAGLSPCDTGAVWLDGKDLSECPPERRGFGVVFQDYALFPHLTVRQNVEFGLRVRHVSKPERLSRAQAMLERLGLADFADRRTAGLSGGEQQRVALGRALAFNPKILLMDEPFSALDEQLRDRLREELLTIVGDLGLTTVYVTHDQGEALSLGHEMIVMKAGHIVQAGAPRDLYERPTDAFVAEFLGAANIIEGSCTRQDGGCLIQLPFATFSVDSPWAGWGRLVLRPEDIHRAIGAARQWTGRIESATFLGDHIRLTVRCQETRLSVQVPSDTTIEIGTPMDLCVDLTKLVWLPRNL